MMNRRPRAIPLIGIPPEGIAPEVK